MVATAAAWGGMAAERRVAAAAVSMSSPEAGSVVFNAQSSCSSLEELAAVLARNDAKTSSSSNVRVSNCELRRAEHY